jgi:hypothetical protein
MANAVPARKPAAIRVCLRPNNVFASLFACLRPDEGSTLAQPLLGTAGHGPSRFVDYRL